MPRVRRRYFTRRVAQEQRNTARALAVYLNRRARSESEPPRFLPRLRSQARRLAGVASEIEATEEASSSSSSTTHPSNSDSSIDWDSSDDSGLENNIHRVVNSGLLRLPAHLRENADFFSDGSEDEFFEGFGDDEDDNEIGMDRIAEVIVYLESGEFPNYDGLNNLDRIDAIMSDDGDLPDDPFQRELLGSMPEPTMSLHTAALRGNARELQRWKNWKFPLCGGSHQKDSPLHCAARAGDVGAVEELLEQGASTSDANLFHHTPLEIAARSGHIAVVKTLLKHGAGEDPDEMDRAYEATNSWTVVEVLRAFEDMDLKAIPPKLLDKAVPWISQMMFRAVQQGRLNILKGLLAMDANPNRKGILGRTPLQIAVRRGHVKCASALLEAGALVNAKDDFKWTALHYAGREGHHDVALLLLKAGADVTAKCRNGRTPLAMTTDEATKRLLRNYKNA